MRGRANAAGRGRRFDARDPLGPVPRRTPDDRDGASRRGRPLRGDLAGRGPRRRGGICCGPWSRTPRVAPPRPSASRASAAERRGEPGRRGHGRVLRHRRRARAHARRARVAVRVARARAGASRVGRAGGRRGGGGLRRLGSHRRRARGGLRRGAAPGRLAPREQRRDPGPVAHARPRPRTGGAGRGDELPRDGLGDAVVPAAARGRSPREDRERRLRRGDGVGAADRAPTPRRSTPSSRSRARPRRSSHRGGSAS